MISFNTTSYSVNLPNPTFGDTINSSAQLTVRRTLANSQRTIITSSSEKVFNLTVANITIQQKIDFEAVLNEMSQPGEDVSYTDIDVNDWTGYITNFPFDFVETYTRTRTAEQVVASDDGGPIERRYSCTVVFRGNSA